MVMHGETARCAMLLELATGSGTARLRSRSPSLGSAMWAPSFTRSSWAPSSSTATRPRRCPPRGSRSSGSALQQSPDHQPVGWIILHQDDRPRRCRVLHTSNALPAAAASSPRGESACFGHKKWNVPPFPSSDSTHAVPPCISTSRLTIARPTPIPSSAASLAARGRSV